MVELGSDGVRGIPNTIPGVRSVDRVPGNPSFARRKGGHAASGRTGDDSRRGDVAEGRPAPPTPEELASEIDELERLAVERGLGLLFAFRRRADGVSIEIVDRRTGAVLRVVPASGIREAVRRLENGSLLIDSTA